MVKNFIKIYARLKQEYSTPKKIATYEVQHTENHAIITLRLNNVVETVNNKPQCHKFRFEKVFDQHASQAELFNEIAKPIIESCLRGCNGTIFAYGQTGSGKTYAITGASNEYNERGLIPRSIAEIFRFVNMSVQHYTVSISYLEIYNEIGYDLLNPKQKISLEELPKVIILEDAKGESHLRNLSVQKVSNEQEAMRLLFLGDTNRTTAETPMNVYSSRSHCIFTIEISSRNSKSGRIRKSKLNLVDLAGSERISKANISGTALSEAKCINLSLHYLEQVVLALSHKRSHVPFRNSVLTYILRESLSGNCKTVLLATLAVNRQNIEETIATCKFAQRVAEVDMEAVINEEIDPQHEIEYLKLEVESLRKQLIQQSHFRLGGKLTKEEKEKWQKIIDSYLKDVKDDLPLTDFDMRHIQYCLKILKEAVRERDDQKLKLINIGESNTAMVEEYQHLIKRKDEEINNLRSLLYTNNAKKSGNLTATETMVNKENVPPPMSDVFSFSPAQKLAFDLFVKDPKNRANLDYYEKSIEEMQLIAKKLITVVDQCQSKIIMIRAVKQPCPNSINSTEMNLELLKQQNIYRKTLLNLQELKNETEHSKQKLQQAKLDLLKVFMDWYESLTNEDSKEHNNSYQKSTRNVNLEYMFSESSDVQDETSTNSESTEMEQDKNPASDFQRPQITKIDDKNNDNNGKKKLHMQVRSRSPRNIKTIEHWVTETSDNGRTNRMENPIKQDHCTQWQRNDDNPGIKLDGEIREEEYSNTGDSFHRKFYTKQRNSGGASCFYAVDTAKSRSPTTVPNNGNKSKNPRCSFLSPYANEHSDCGDLSPDQTTNKIFKYHQVPRANNVDGYKQYSTSMLSDKNPPEPVNNCEVLWKCSTNSYLTQNDHSNLNVDNIAEQLRKPRMIYDYEALSPCDKRGAPQTKAFNGNNYSFSVVYSDMMDLKHSIGDRVQQLISERPYTTEKTLRCYTNNEETTGSNNNNENCAPNQYFFSNYQYHNQTTPPVSPNKESARRYYYNPQTTTTDGTPAISFIKPRIEGFNENNFRGEEGLVNRYYESTFGQTQNPKTRYSRSTSPAPERNQYRNNNNLFSLEDSEEFRHFIRTIPLTGDPEVDEEIIKFYRTKFVYSKNG